ncbi:type IV toxin-antitoxin system AbiEi family antitoxin domain-containing protein [Clostridium nigeriense]|uniref:type IV toxin-antitoxin system AbiEi family antitoxin domain-containing protein n=1 Tax=Clostridium nigeriense TaxID=1805470 RepID=UPI003D3314E6
MSYKEKLEELIKEKNGIVLTKDVTMKGIPREYIRQLVDKGILKRIDRGVYILKDCIDDKLYRLQSKYPSIIFSHFTSIGIHNSKSNKIINYEATVPSGYNSQNIEEYGVKVHHVKKELYEIGICIAKTEFGRDIKIYDIERTICDILRNRNKIDITEINNILKYYAKRNDKDIDKLKIYAKKFRISKVLELYIPFLI